MANLADYFQAFHVYSYEHTMTASARSLYYLLLGEFNRMYWKYPELSKSVRELVKLGGFKCEATVQKAKAELCTEKIIKVRKTKTIDVYALIEPQEWRGNRISANSKETLTENTLTISDDALKKEKKKAPRNHHPIEDLDNDVLHAWIRARDEHPSTGDAEDLLMFQTRYGAEKVAKTIDYCRQHLQTAQVTIAYVAGTLKGSANRSGNNGKVVPIRTNANVDSGNDADFDNRLSEWLGQQTARSY